jgi:hypothetical protein
MFYISVALHDAPTAPGGIASKRQSMSLQPPAALIPYDASKSHRRRDHGCAPAELSGVVRHMLGCERHALRTKFRLISSVCSSKSQRDTYWLTAGFGQSSVLH